MTRRARRRQGAQAASSPDTANPGGAVVDTGGRWRLRNWRLSTKLIAVLLIPVLTLLVLLGVLARDDMLRAEEYAATSSRLGVSAELDDLIQALQLERAGSVRFVAGGRDGGLGDLREAHRRVDAAAGSFDRALASTGTELSDAADSGFQRAEQKLDVLSELRYSVRHGNAAAPDVLASYQRLLSGLLDIGDRAGTVTEDSAFTRSRLAAAAVAKIKEQHSVMRASLSAAIVRGSLSQQRASVLLAAKGKLAAAESEFATFASAEQQRMYSATVRGRAVQERESMLGAALAARQRTLPADLDLARWDNAATKTINELASVQRTLHEQLVRRAATLAGNARTALLVDVGLLIGALLLGGVLAIVIARSLLRPMRTLRRSALEVAEHRLPAAVDGMLADSQTWPDPGQWRRRLEPVPVFSREELGQIARAFDAVHGEAVRLAGEQAMLRENINSMFVNLSRRSQDLVERQLSVLDRMEAHEQDSETLGGLFELDHLATRMRRNSENLLVLSGQELENPVEGSVTAEEVVGAALSEVEQYQRVQASVSPEPCVQSALANDLVHVLSELLENATDYSPDSSEVSLTGSVTAQGDWLLEITDWGAGMADVELRRVNRRLAEPPEVDVEVSRRMGLYVVARLSARHDLEVRLGQAETGGVTASVLVPARSVTIVMRTEQAPVPEPDATSRLPRAHEWPSGEQDAAHALVAAAQDSPAPAAATVDEPREDATGATDVGAPGELGEEEFEGARAAEPDEADAYAPDEVVVDQLGNSGRTACLSGELDAEPDWPTSDSDSDPHPLTDDTPTERLPAYRDVLADWFELGLDGKLGDLLIQAPLTPADNGDELAWPASVDSVWIDARGGSRHAGSGDALPKRVPHADIVPAAEETPAMDETPVLDGTPAHDPPRADGPPAGEHAESAEHAEPTEEVPTIDDLPTQDALPAVDRMTQISRTPDDVRERMVGLRSGLARGKNQNSR